MGKRKEIGDENPRRFSFPEIAIRVMIVLSLMFLLVSMAFPWFSVEFHRSGPEGEFYFQEEHKLSGVRSAYDVPGDNTSVVEDSKSWEDTDYLNTHKLYNTMTLLLILAVLLTILAYISLISSKKRKSAGLSYIPLLCNCIVLFTIFFFFSIKLGPAIQEDAQSIGMYYEEYLLKGIQSSSGWSAGSGSAGESEMEWGPGAGSWLIFFAAFIQIAIIIALLATKGRKRKSREFGEKPEWMQRIDRWKLN